MPGGSGAGQTGREVRYQSKMPEDGDLNAVGLLHQSSIPLSACASFRPALYLALSPSLALLSACASLSHSLGRMSAQLLKYVSAVFIGDGTCQGARGYPAFLFSVSHSPLYASNNLFSVLYGFMTA